MKTIKRQREDGQEIIKRVSNVKANFLTGIGWVFCPKSEWKKKVRDVS